MNLSTVFDGILPASPTPGVGPGDSVVVWTPTKDGVYQVIISAPDETGTPFGFNTQATVDLDSSGGATVDPIFAGGSATNEFSNGDPVAGSATLATWADHDVRVIVKVGLVMSPDGIGVDDGMIVPLDEIKRSLGIDLLDTSEDESLILLESYAAAYVENQTERRWRAPATKVEYQMGNGTRFLYLEGRIEATPPDITIREGGPGDWTAFTDFEFRAPNKLVRTDALGWHPLTEYEITYLDGWTIAPADIRALVLDLMTVAWNASDTGEAEIKSETIGDYSYTLESVAAAASSISSASVDTLNRRRAKHV